MVRNLICISFLFTLAGCVANRGYQSVEPEDPCPWTQEQRQVAWENALQALWDWDAEYYAYCEENDAVGDREFEIVGGVCRTPAVHQQRIERRRNVRRTTVRNI